jgi:hypothetical protein
MVIQISLSPKGFTKNKICISHETFKLSADLGAKEHSWKKIAI